MGDEDSRKIFVGGTRDADQKMLEDYFMQFGAIESCKVRWMNEWMDERVNSEWLNEY